MFWKIVRNTAGVLAVGFTVLVLVSDVAYRMSTVVAQPIEPASAAPFVGQDTRWNAFFYAVLLRHEAECPTPRTAQFRSARKALLNALAPRTDAAYFNEVNAQLSDPAYIATTRGFLCRMATEQVTLVMRTMYE